MSDHRLRELERRWRRTRDPEEGAGWLAERLRRGELARERVELAAHVGHPAALALLGAGSAARRWPTRLFRAGVDVPLPVADALPPAGRPAALTLDEQLTILVRNTRALAGRREQAAALAIALSQLRDLGARDIVCSLDGAFLPSSAGLMVLLDQGDRLRDASGCLHLIELSPRQRRHLDDLGLEGIFTIREDLDDVLAHASFPLPVGAQGQSWLRALIRWGPEPCVRAALALGRPEQGGNASVARHQATAWLEQVPARRPVPDPLVAPAELSWSQVATVTAQRRMWPNRLPTRIDPDAVREALTAWALGDAGEVEP